METFSTQTQEKPKRKSKFQMILLIGLIVVLAVVVTLDVLSFTGTIKIRGNVNSELGQEKRYDSIIPDLTPNFPKDYTSCLSKYSEEYMPNEISGYKLTTVYDKTSTFKKDFQPKGANHQKLEVKWGLTGKYVKSHNDEFRFAIYEISEDSYQGSRMESAINNAMKFNKQTISNLPVSYSDSEVLTIIPSTHVLVDFDFLLDNKNSEIIFQNWLSTIC